jgi:recombinase
MRAQARADCYGYLLLDIQAWRSESKSLAAIATRLNTAGHVTTGGKPFSPMTVGRILL